MPPQVESSPSLPSPPSTDNTGDDEDDATTSSLREPLLTPEEEPQIQPQQRRPKPSRNVTLTLIYTVFAFSGRSIWSQSVLAAYVYLLRDNNPEAVGYITAVLGMGQLLSSVPAGIVADAHRRDVLLKLASVIGCLALSVTCWACWKESYVCLVMALAVWGVYYGVTNTTIGALFADSIPLGDRSYYFTQRSSLLSLGNVCGPAVSLALFLTLGDHWKIRDCAIVMAVGQCICFPGIMVLCFFNDKYIVLQQEDEEQEQDLMDDSEAVAESTLPPAIASEDEEATEETSSNEENTQRTYLFWKPCLSPHRLIPAQIATADVISGLASGMSIRYFPIFFVNNLHLSPVQVQILYICSPLGMALLMKTAQRLSASYGRLHVVVLHKWIGIALMLAMIGTYMLDCPRAVVCAIYVLRTAFMNSTGALTRSTLMDHVPQAERGKWSALESVNMFSWSGSAALGGVLVSRSGLLPVFGVTALLQFVGTWPLVLLFGCDVTEGSVVATARSRQQPPSRQQSSLLPSGDTNEESSSSSSSSSAGEEDDA